MGISIYQIVLVSIVLITSGLPFIYVDITRHSRGIVRSKSKDVALKTTIGGEIQWVRLADNQKVRKGDTLLVISDIAIREKIALTDSIYQSVRSLAADISLLLTDSISELSTAEARQMFNTFRSEKQQLEEKVRNALNSLRRQKQLYDKNVIAQQEYEKARFEFRKTQQATESLIHKYRLSWEDRLFDLEQRMKELNKELSSLAEAHKGYFIIAPISGTLERVMGSAAGSAVSSSQEIGVISPDADLLVENFVSPGDIGLIDINQSVIFHFDAFHFRHWGVIYGKVLEIDKNISLSDQGSYFRVYCELQDNMIGLNNGYQSRIAKGMTLTTYYTIARRNLADLIFDTLGDWLDPRQSGVDKSPYL